MAVDEHYENFPVASFLVPARIRPCVVAIYRFARHADDLADEGDTEPAVRLAALTALDDDVKALFSGRPVTLPTVLALAPLRDAGIPGLDERPFRDLLSAFMQDVRIREYGNYSELLDYCRRSANPVGRLMLALMQVRDAAAAEASDHICTALQLINFWQDAAIDAARGRVYVPQEDFARHNVSAAGFPKHPQHRAVMRYQCERTGALMDRGAALLPHLSGTFRLEIAFTIAGGLCILEKIAGNDFDVRSRPVLRWYDSFRLVFLAARALFMSPRHIP
jgi:squalene synthase HpnC